MKFTFDEARAAHAIVAYAPGWVRIGDMRIETPCVVTGTALHVDLLPPRPELLDASHFSKLVELSPEIILLGTGRRQIFVDHEHTRMLAELRIGLEVMDTGAACRSFNLLSGDGRSVMAALFMI